MKFALIPIALAGAALAAPTTLEARQTGYCAANRKALAYGYAEQYLYDLAFACVDNTQVTSSANLWADKNCVAAALASNIDKAIIPDTLVGAASCKNPDGIKSAQSQPSLDYNIYAEIVGDCAWQEGGCPVTQQNFIDFVYSTLTALGKGNWPSSVDVVLESWNQELAWTLTGDTIPYTNLNDFLHYYHAASNPVGN
ncbi:hypothetical protein C8Q74DRAFT_1371246 [Fomes fomentarius]|nr:hypothetical protein C8Q74DRAFT_1371246 [Fomes fomentarius]